MLCKSTLHLKWLLWWWKSVFHVSLSLFMSLCPYVFISLSFSHDVGIMLWSCWKWKLMGCWYEKERKFMWLWSCFMSLSHVMLRKWKNKWRLCVRILLENGKRRGLWGLIGGKYGVHGTFLLDSQPLVDFFYCFWSMRLSKSIHM